MIESKTEVLSTLSNKRMTKYQNRCSRRLAPLAEPVTKVPDTNVFQAPTVRLEDKIFTIGTTADAAKFEVVKEELAKHFVVAGRIGDHLIQSR